jgi:hypothetical protein
VDAQCSEATYPHLRIIPFHSASTLTEVFELALVMDMWGPNQVEEVEEVEEVETVELVEAVAEPKLHLKDDLKANILDARQEHSPT